MIRYVHEPTGRRFRSVAVMPYCELTLGDWFAELDDQDRHAHQRTCSYSPDTRNVFEAHVLNALYNMPVIYLEPVNVSIPR